MKKNHNTQNRLKELYFYLDNFIDYVMNDEKMSKEDRKKMDSLYPKYSKKFGDVNTIELEEYYGLFRIDGKVAIDPKRYKKICGLDDDILEVMKKRSTTYFYPEKYNREEYYVVNFVDEINSIISDYKKTYKPIIDKSIENIEAIPEVVAGDYSNLQMGISGAGAASAWANYTNAMNRDKIRFEKFELKNSLYAQFFHQMVSRIEAITIKMANVNNPGIKSWNRNNLYDGFTKKGPVRDLKHFKSHDKLYCIWNFIKHNTESTFEALLKYPEVLVTDKYVSGDLAVRYVKLNEELILELLDGTKQFFIEFCDLIFDEKYVETTWNYARYFIENVHDTIEGYVNPLGLTIFDEMD